MYQYWIIPVPANLRETITSICTYPCIIQQCICGQSTSKPLVHARVCTYMYVLRVSTCPKVRYVLLSELDKHQAQAQALRSYGRAPSNIPQWRGRSDKSDRAPVGFSGLVYFLGWAFVDKSSPASANPL